MRALVIYESMFGDNRKVALAIAEGLIEGSVDADTVEVNGAPSAIPADIDLLIVGSPNHGWGMPRPSSRKGAATKTHEPLVSEGIGVREWLGAASLPPGLRTAAFDTRAAHLKVVVSLDHASASIEKGLAKLGAVPAAPAEHFFVSNVTGPLAPGEIDRARAWGTTLAGEVLS